MLGVDKEARGQPFAPADLHAETNVGVGAVPDSRYAVFGHVTMVNAHNSDIITEGRPDAI